MKNTLLILLFATIGCNNTTTTASTDSTKVTTHPDTQHELHILDSVLKQYETPTQHLKASASNPSRVTGAKGTIIRIKPQDLTTVSGKPMGNHIDIDLKELTTTEELARERITTKYRGDVYSSAGVFLINMTSGGEQLKLKQDKTLDVSLFANTDKSNDVSYMLKDDLGKINWKQDGEYVGRVEIYESTVIVKDDSTNAPSVVGNKKPSKPFIDIFLKNFGWMTCREMLYNPNTTTVTIDINKADTVNWVSAYLIFKDINSVLQDYYEMAKETCSFYHVPIGSKVTLVVVGIRNGKMLTATSQILVTADQKVPMKLKETPEAEVANLFKLK